MTTSKSKFNVLFSTIHTRLSLLICALLLVGFTSCKEDSTPKPQLDEAAFTATISKIESIANNGNLSDISIAFSIPNALEAIDVFRVIVAKTENTNQVTVSSLQNLSSDSYFEIHNTEKSYTITLPTSLKTYLGEEIVEGQGYKVAVLSKGTFNNENVEILSNFSDEFVLSSVASIQVTTLVNNIGANDGISVDTEGNIYASFYGRNAGKEVLKITPEGTVSTFVDGLQGPLGNAMDSEGNMYVAHKNTFAEGTITKIAPDGTRTDVAVISGYIAGIKLDAEDNLYVTNYLEGKINKITPEGEVSVFVSDPLLAGGVGIDFDENGDMWIGNYVNGNILKVTSEGEVTKVATVPTTVADNVIGYITYLNGAVYATAIGENKIYKITPNGTLEHFAGNGASETKDGDLLNASLAGVNGITSDKTNNILYMTQAAQGKFALRKIQL